MSQAKVHKPIYSNRLYVVMALLCLAGLVLMLRAADIQVLDNEFLRDQGDARHLRTLPIAAYRGMITDRHGDVLAASTPVVSVWMNPPLYNASAVQEQQLAQLLEMSAGDIRKLFRDRQDRSFVYLKRHLEPSVKEKLQALDIEGVYTQEEFRRYYPGAETAAHLVGFTDIDDAGQEGIELAYESSLRGIPGKQRVVRDRKGHIIENVELLDSPVHGRDIQLSIDRRIQYIAYRELKEAMHRHNARSASLVLLDTHTGELLALVNQPSFNPNNRDSFTPDNIRNRAVTDLYEPGSTVKPFTVLAGLRSGQYNPASVIDTGRGHWRIGNFTVRDTGRHDRMLTVAEAIKHSSNVGMAHIASNIPKQTFWETLSDAGFGEKTESGFPGEVGGHLPFFGEWTDIDRATLAYGYGVSVTAMKLAQIYSVLANDGVYRPISMLKTSKPLSTYKLFDADQVAKVRHMLEAVVDTGGTGVRASVKGFSVAGKTGTVHKIGDDGYAMDKYTALFAGFAPAGAPRLVAVVTMDEPSNGNHYGGQVAAPVFSQVMASALRLLSIPPDKVKDPPYHLAQVRP